MRYTYLVLLFIWLPLDVHGSIGVSSSDKYTLVTSDHPYDNLVNAQSSAITRTSTSYYHVSFSVGTVTEQNYDYVTIFDGSVSGTQLFRNSGNTWNDQVVYAPSGLVFQFTTDGSGTYYGFDAYVSAALFTTNIDSNTLVVETPHSYPSNYVAHSSLIKFDSSNIYDIEWDTSTATESCCDKVRILSGDQVKGSSSYLYEFSGTSFYSVSVTSSSGLFFEFFADGSVTAYGFKATVRAGGFPTLSPTPIPSEIPTPNPTPLPTIRRYIVQNPTGDYSCQTNENPGTFLFNQCYKL